MKYLKFVTDLCVMEYVQPFELLVVIKMMEFYPRFISKFIVLVQII